MSFRAMICAVLCAIVLGFGVAAPAATVDDLNTCQTMCIVMGTRDLNLVAEQDCGFLSCVAGCLCGSDGYIAMTDPWTICVLDKLRRVGCY